jgi:hypothetical protein
LPTVLNKAGVLRGKAKKKVMKKARVLTKAEVVRGKARTVLA